MPQFGPEFVNNDTYPKPRQERQEQALEETWKYNGDDEASGSISANAVRVCCCSLALSHPPLSHA
jgi:hypothetical protein